MLACQSLSQNGCPGMLAAAVSLPAGDAAGVCCRLAACAAVALCWLLLKELIRLPVYESNRGSGIERWLVANVLTLEAGLKLAKVELGATEEVQC